MPHSQRYTFATASLSPSVSIFFLRSASHSQTPGNNARRDHGNGRPLRRIPVKQEAWTVAPQLQDHKDLEQNDVRLPFPKHRRPQWMIAVLQASQRTDRVEHAKIAARGRTVRAAIHKIRIATDALRQQQPRSGHVGEGPEGDFLDPGIDESGDDRPDNAALNRQSAMPNRDDLAWMLGVQGGKKKRCGRRMQHHLAKARAVSVQMKKENRHTQGTL